MSLRAFHLVFIALSAVLAFAFAAWCLGFEEAEGRPGFLALGVGSLLAGVALLVYGAWVYGKLGGADRDGATKGRFWVIPGGSRGRRPKGRPGV